MIQSTHTLRRTLAKKKTANSGDPFFSKTRSLIKNLNVFWFGFAVYTLGFIYSNDEKFFLWPTKLQAIQAFALILMAIGSVSLMKFRFDDPYLKTVFTVFMIYTLTVVIRGFQTDFNFVKKMLFNPFYGMLHYFLPLVILLPRNINLYKKVFNVLFFFSLFYFVLLISYSGTLLDPRWDNEFGKGMTELLFQNLTLPTGFLLLTFAYHTNKKLLITGIVFLITIYFLILRARRGGLFIAATILIGALLLYLSYTKKQGLTIALLVILVPVMTIYLTGVKLPGMFDFLLARGTEDTRSGVEQYMSVSMSNLDWLIGKGINGKYYCPIIINMETMDYTRDVVETGYLQIILKGGYMSLLLMGMILFPAVYKGLFDSKNLLTKGAATLIILWMISLHPTVVDGFTMQYMIVWVSVGICYSKKIRDLPNKSIINYLKS